ncbi:hypothetical protein ACULLL_09255 [Lysinibacillus irui]|uniref:hypothetical protein n=1 Tax=Lysinibacillus irui TaxID=2998077 RepID=UPI004043ABA2
MVEKNLVNIEKFKQKYKFVVRSIWGQYAANKDGSPIYKQYIVIKIKNIKTDSEIIHPITEFILAKWKSQSFNTMKASAYTISMFLNFLIENKGYYQLKNLSKLKFEHGTEFLNDLTYKKTPKSTVKKHERILIVFFNYLIENGFIDDNEMSITKISEVNQLNIITKTKSPFKKVEYYKNSDSYSIHQLPEEYILKFLEVAYQINSPIALGIYMQFFGGLRIGEECNLRVKDLQLIGASGENGFLVNLTADRNLRIDLNNTTGSNYIKSKRWQIVFGFKNWSVLFYEKHMSNIQSNNINGESPLFINRNGLAMTGSSYYYHFKKVKLAFLKKLRDSPNSKDRLNAITLENCKWSTHIGRGIFSNLLAEEADNVYDISFPRGDKNFNSVRPYIANSKKMKTKLEAKITEIYENNLVNLD